MHDARFLAAQQEKVRAEYARLRTALAAGTITRKEYDFYISNSFDGKTEAESIGELQRAIDDIKLGQAEQQAGVTATQPVQSAPPSPFNATNVALSLLFIIVAGFLLWNGPAGMAAFPNGGSVTGLVPLDLDDVLGNGTHTLNASRTILIEQTAVERVALSGSFTGERLLVELTDGSSTYTIHDYTRAPFVLTVDKDVYGLGETVNATIEPAGNVSYYVYVPGQEDPVPVTGTYTVVDLGVHRLDAIIATSDGSTKLSVEFIVQNTSANETSPVTSSDTGIVEFVDACGAACDIAPPLDNPELMITVDGELDVDMINVSEAIANTAPAQNTDLPDITLGGGTITIDLDNYFTDADGDVLTYEVNNMVGVDEEISGSLLTLTGAIAGSYTTYVYASDLVALTQSNTFTVTVPAVETNDTNETVTLPVNVTDAGTTNGTGGGTETTNTTVNDTQTVVVIEEPLDPCDDPNPNNRPASCFGEQLDYAFEEVVAPLRNKDRATVGRFTRFGNLIIKGLVHEDSAGSPGSMDFQIGYSTTAGFQNTFHSTAWIDSVTGDLHLRGFLYEEQGAITPPQYNTYIIQNGNGIVLGYFNENTGDLYLKGNIVQLGKI